MPIEKRWVVKPQGDPATAAMLAAALRISPVLANLLVQRGIDTVEKAEKCFKPSLADLHDPFLMKDMEKAVERVERAVANQEKIMVYGDYDVDGITATGILVDYLQSRGVDIDMEVKVKEKEPYEGPIHLETPKGDISLRYKAALRIFLDDKK